MKKGTSTKSQGRTAQDKGRLAAKAIVNDLLTDLVVLIGIGRMSRDLPDAPDYVLRGLDALMPKINKASKALERL